MIMDALKYRKAKMVSKADESGGRGSHSILFNKSNIENTTSFAKEAGKLSQSAKKVCNIYFDRLYESVLYRLISNQP